MGNLGDAVSALLDTYTKCLSLLKRLDRPSQQQLPDNDNTSVSIRTVKDASSPSGLAAALRKARTRVSRSYSSGFARRGSAFAKGDGELLCFPALHNETSYRKHVLASPGVALWQKTRKGGG